MWRRYSTLTIMRIVAEVKSLSHNLLVVELLPLSELTPQMMDQAAHRMYLF